jgi:hypothetical protein
MNLFKPVIKLSGTVQLKCLGGSLLEKITISAIYVAIIKSCLNKKTLFVLQIIDLFITLAAMTNLYLKSSSQKFYQSRKYNMDRLIL